MKILGPDKFSKEDIDGMRETLHESEWEGLKDRDLRHMTWEGCIGWKNIPDAEVVEHYQNIYGESSNLEIVQGEIVAKFNDVKLSWKLKKENKALKFGQTPRQMLSSLGNVTMRKKGKGLITLLR